MCIDCPVTFLKLFSLILRLTPIRRKVSFEFFSFPEGKGLKVARGNTEKSSLAQYEF